MASSRSTAVSRPRHSEGYTSRQTHSMPLYSSSRQHDTQTMHRGKVDISITTFGLLNPEPISISSRDDYHIPLESRTRSSFNPSPSPSSSVSSSSFSPSLSTKSSPVSTPSPQPHHFHEYSSPASHLHSKPSSSKSTSKSKASPTHHHQIRPATQSQSNSNSNSRSQNQPSQQQKPSFAFVNISKPSQASSREHKRFVKSFVRNQTVKSVKWGGGEGVSSVSSFSTTDGISDSGRRRKESVGGSRGGGGIEGLRTFSIKDTGRTKDVEMIGTEAY